jgi:hypothetical protein
MRLASIVAATAFTLAAGAGTADPVKDYTITPAGTAKFAPVDPKQPKGAQVAIIQGDPAKGPVAFLLKLPKGPLPVHWHTADYWAVVVEGQSKHWLPGKEADAKANGPGTAWYQPGGSAAAAHGDECVSDSCTVFIYMNKKLDLNVVPPPAKK